MSLPTVRANNGLDDRQAEAAAAITIARRGPAEALEGTPEELLGKSRAPIEHMNLDRPVLTSGLEVDPAGAVAQRVVNHAANYLIEAQPVGIER
jgi:hypothetical protein